MNTAHQITKEELIEITMGYECNTPVTFSEFVTTFTNHEVSDEITDENGVGEHKDGDLIAAGVFLRALEKEGFVIVRKSAPATALNLDAPDYITRS